MEGFQLDADASQVSLRIPPFIHLLADGCLLRLRKTLMALVVNLNCKPDIVDEFTKFLGYKLDPLDGDLDLEFYRTTLTGVIMDISSLQNQEDHFSDIDAYDEFASATQTTYVALKEVLSMWKTLHPEYKAELASKEPKLRDLRPSYVWPLEADDLLDDGDDLDDFDEGAIDNPNPPIKDFKQHWPQFLRHNAPGVEGALGSREQPWYVSGHLIPHVGVRMLERWDDEWKRMMDAVGPNNPDGTPRYKPPSWRKAQSTIDTSSSGSFVRVSQRRGQHPGQQVPQSGLSKSRLDSEATGDLAYFDRMLRNLEPQQTDDSWESLAIFTAYKEEDDGIDWRDLD